MLRLLRTTIRFSLLFAVGFLTHSASAQSGCNVVTPFEAALDQQERLDARATVTRQRGEGTDWVNVSRYFYGYESPQSAAVTVVGWDAAAGDWADPARGTTYAYDGAGRLVETVGYSATEGNPPYKRYVVAYGADGYPEVETEEEWDGTGWVDDERTTYDYTADGQIASYVAERAPAPGSPLEASFRFDAVFDDAGRRVGCEFRTEAGATPYRRHRITFDDQDRRASVVKEEWEGGAFVARDSAAFAYGAGGLVLQEQFRPTASGWDLAERYTLDYDEAGRRTGGLWEVSLTSGGFSAYQRRTLEYGDAGRVVSEATERYDRQGEVWLPSDRYLYAYTEASTPVAPGPAAAELALAVAPNPSAGAVVAELSTETAAEARVAVLDVLGRQLRVAHEGPVAAGETALPIDLTGLPSGVYVVRATVGGAVVSRAVTVAR